MRKVKNSAVRKTKKLTKLEQQAARARALESQLGALWQLSKAIAVKVERIEADLAGVKRQADYTSPKLVACLERLERALADLSVDPRRFNGLVDPRYRQW